MAPVKPVLAGRSTLSESSNQPQHNNQSIVEVGCKGVYKLQLSDPSQERSA